MGEAVTRTRPGATSVRVRWFAGARAAAGTPAEDAVPREDDTVATLTARLAADRPGLARVLAACSFLLDGVAARPHDPVGDAAVLDVLPPFSGG